MRHILLGVSSLKPEEYEQSIAEHYRKHGYVVNLTKKSYDYGVDVIARKDSEAIAIQAKMYHEGARQTSYKDIMYLFAGKSLYDCSEAILITSGTVKDEAKDVAIKLNVKVIENWMPSDSIKVDTKKECPSFEDAWGKYIIPLKGMPILTLSGRENILTDVNMNYVERISSTGKKSKIYVDIFKQCYSYIIDHGSIEKGYINHIYPKRASAIIFMILAEIPYFEIRYNPEPILKHDKKKML
jgi:hypothetical protein